MGLERFIEAQDDVYDDVLDELRSGEKRSHWMWFIFPQIAGLGRSSMARRYAIESVAEAEEYLAHPVLGARLRECVSILKGLEGRSISRIMGYPDDLKLRSCLTLFSKASGGEQCFEDALDKYYAGEHDPETLKAIRTV
jgi:uncharacterized protein (DUF1810 family)